MFMLGSLVDGNTNAPPSAKASSNTVSRGSGSYSLLSQHSAMRLAIGDCLNSLMYSGPISSLLHGFEGQAWKRQVQRVDSDIDCCDHLSHSFNRSRFRQQATLVVF